MTETQQGLLVGAVQGLLLLPVCMACFWVVNNFVLRKFSSALAAIAGGCGATVGVMFVIVSGRLMINFIDVWPDYMIGARLGMALGLVVYVVIQEVLKII